jgi:26S proteasome regulatory subunit N12
LAFLSVRIEIAKCSEKAYQFLPIADAITLLYFKTQEEFLQFCGQVGWSVDLQAKRIVFSSSVVDENQVPVKEVVHHVLNYAMELEKIV